MTNEANDGVECLTFGDIYALAGPESQGIDSRNDAEALASELGPSTDLPDASLDIVGPGEESGPFASFVEMVDRKSVVSGKSVSVRVGPGGCRILNKKRHATRSDEVTRPSKKEANYTEA